MNDSESKFTTNIMSDSIANCEDIEEEGDSSMSNETELTDCLHHSDMTDAAIGEDEEVDPRIENKLEELNQWTTRINTLEMEFEEANNNFRAFLTECSDKLKNIARRVGTKHVAEARPYFEAKDRARDYQKNCQRTVLAYERACQALLQAKEEIEMTEKKFKNQSENGTDFDVTWQEVLNQATLKVQEAERQKKLSKSNHETCMREFIATEELISLLERKLKTPIKKARPYFDESAKFKVHLLKIKTEIDMLTEKIVASKSCYSVTLKDLESISEEIHERRNSKLVISLRREPGVGAEFTSLSGSSTNIAIAAPINYSEIVPELDVISPRFHIDAQSEKLAVLNKPREMVRSCSMLSQSTVSTTERCDMFDSSCDESRDENQVQLSVSMLELSIDNDKSFEDVALD